MVDDDREFFFPFVLRNIESFLSVTEFTFCLTCPQLPRIYRNWQHCQHSPRSPLALTSQKTENRTDAVSCPHSTRTILNYHNALLATVLENPADDTARLVLADLLRESDDPYEQARGRFLWGGVTAARYRGQKFGEDQLYWIARKELTTVADQGSPAMWLVSLGIGADRFAVGDRGWNSDYDSVTVRVGPWHGVFTRGMLSELSVTFIEWYELGAAALARWPLTFIQFLGYSRFGLSHRQRG